MKSHKKNDYSRSFHIQQIYSHTLVFTMKYVIALSWLDSCTKRCNNQPIKWTTLFWTHLSLTTAQIAADNDRKMERKRIRSNVRVSFGSNVAENIRNIAWLTPTNSNRNCGSSTLTETDSGTASDLDSKLMATLYCAEHFTLHKLRIYFCKGQESKSESVPESVSGNVNEPSL